MFGRVNVWGITELKVRSWGKKLANWIDFDHKDTIYKLKFGWLKFLVKHGRFAKLFCCQTFLLCANLCTTAKNSWSLKCPLIRRFCSILRDENFEFCGFCLSYHGK